MARMTMLVVLLTSGVFGCADAYESDDEPAIDGGVDESTDGATDMAARDFGREPDVLEGEFGGTALSGCDWHFELGLTADAPTCEAGTGQLSVVVGGSADERVGPGTYPVMPEPAASAARMELCATWPCVRALSGRLEIETFDEGELAVVAFEAQFEDGSRVAGRAEVREWCEGHIDCI